MGVVKSKDSVARLLGFETYHRKVTIPFGASCSVVLLVTVNPVVSDLSINSRISCRINSPSHYRSSSGKRRRDEDKANLMLSGQKGVVQSAGLS